MSFDVFSNYFAYLKWSQMKRHIFYKWTIWSLKTLIEIRPRYQFIVNVFNTSQMYVLVDILWLQNGNLCYNAVSFGETWNPFTDDTWSRSCDTSFDLGKSLWDHNKVEFELPDMEIPCRARGRSVWKTYFHQVVILNERQNKSRFRWNLTKCTINIRMHMGEGGRNGDTCL